MKTRWFKRRRNSAAYSQKDQAIEKGMTGSSVDAVKQNPGEIEVAYPGFS